MHPTADSIRAVAKRAPPAAATRTCRVPAGAESEGARRQGAQPPAAVRYAPHWPTATVTGAPTPPQRGVVLPRNPHARRV